MCLVILKNPETVGCAKNCSFCKSGNRTSGMEISKPDNRDFRQKDFSIKELLLTGNILLKGALQHQPVNK
jgi:radical SAM superfamily enzyme YgiQ (UPF0313 family)